jgi:hypothetical protein
MGSVHAAYLYINGSRDARVPIDLPGDDPNVPATVGTRVRTIIILSAHDIAEIGKNGTYYDLRVRLYEEDNSPWPWGDDNDDQVWQERPRLQAVGSQTVIISAVVPIIRLRDLGAEYYAGVRLYRRTNSGMSNLHSQRTNTVIVEYVQPS